MFVELLPLLAKRSLAITACALSDGEVLLTITPKAKDKDEKSPKPYTIQGPAAEVDAGLAAELISHADTVSGFYSSLEDLKASTEATLKEVKAESDKKIAEAKKNGKGSSSAAKPTPAPAKPETPKAPAPPSLFDEVPAQPEATLQVAVVASVETPAAAVATAKDEEDDDPSGYDDEDEASEAELEGVPEAFQIQAMAPAVTADSQSNMFSTSSTFEAEEEVLKEAFHGVEDQFIAA